MSCDWDVWCLDCEVGLGLSDWNHRTEQVQDLIRARDALAALADAHPGASVAGFEYHGSWKDHVPVAFFAEHRGHRLIPRNEYGECFDECTAQIFCEHCRSQTGRCRLPKGHEGAHSPERPAT